MKLYNSQQERSELVEWVCHDTQFAISQESSIPQSTVGEIRRNPDKNATVSLFRKVSKAIKEWRLKTIQDEQRKFSAENKDARSRESLQSLIISELSDMNIIELINTYKNIINSKQEYSK